MAINPSMRPMIGIGLALVVVAGMVGFSKWREEHTAELIPWRDDLTAALLEAKSSNKPVLAYFTASWCPPCQEMKRTTWADPSVDEAMRRYVPVKIDVDAHPELTRKYGINPIPAYVVLNDAGEAQRRAVGGMAAPQMVAWLKR